MRIGELARRSGSSATTLRYYEELGLLPRVPRTTSGYREYPEDTLDQLALVQRAKELGFSLGEIRIFLARPRGTSREGVLAAVASKLTALEGKQTERLRHLDDATRERLGRGLIRVCGGDPVRIAATLREKLS